MPTKNSFSRFKPACHNDDNDNNNINNNNNNTKIDE